MDVDKFGHNLNKRFKMDNTVSSTSTHILALANDSEFDAQYKTIKHLGEPIDLRDCATKEYVDQSVNELFNKFIQKNYVEKAIAEIENKIKNNSESVKQLNSDVQSLKNNIEVLGEKIKKAK